MRFEDLLVQHKAQARPEDAMVPILEPALLTYAALWPRVGLTRVAEPVGSSWEDLWACVQWDVAGMAMLMDVPENKAANVLHRLKALRVIYPDGSVPDLVRKLINKRVQDALKQDVR